MKGRTDLAVRFLGPDTSNYRSNEPFLISSISAIISDMRACSFVCFRGTCAESFWQVASKPISLPNGVTGRFKSDPNRRSRQFTTPADERGPSSRLTRSSWHDCRRKDFIRPPKRRAQLIRRLYFDLTGLPPTPAEVQAFVSDPSPKAYEKLVDRLLASPRYGERWGQHWLDVVRFAETDGFEYDTHRKDAWRYRDYVIRSFNDDKPYDQFVREQLAGDEIDSPNEELKIAAGFHRLGPLRKNAGNQEVASSRNEVLTEMTNVVGAALLGVTLGCARCHDHKFDPIRQTDYYRMQAFFAKTHDNDIPLASPEEKAAWKAKT